MFPSYPEFKTFFYLVTEFIAYLSVCLAPIFIVSLRNDTKADVIFSLLISDCSFLLVNKTIGNECGSNVNSPNKTAF